MATKAELLTQIVKKYNELKDILKKEDKAFLEDVEIVALRKKLKDNALFIQQEFKINKLSEKSNNSEPEVSYLALLDDVNPLKEIEDLSSRIDVISKAIKGAKDEAIFAEQEKDFEIVKKNYENLKDWIGKNKKELGKDYDDVVYKLEKVNGKITSTETWIKSRKDIQVEGKTKKKVLKNSSATLTWTLHERKGFADIKRLQKKINRVKKGKNKKASLANLEKELQNTIVDKTKESEAAMLQMEFFLEKIQETKGNNKEEYWQIKSVLTTAGGSETAGGIYLSGEDAKINNTKGSSTAIIPLKASRAADKGQKIDAGKIIDSIEASEDPLHEHTFFKIPSGISLDPIKLVKAFFTDVDIPASDAKLAISVSIITDKEGIPKIEVKGNDDNLYKEFSYKEGSFTKTLYYYGDLDKASKRLAADIKALTAK
jgi:hypothetical protein